MKINKEILIFALLLLIGLVAFYNSFDNAFLMDDFPMLVGNLFIGAPDFLQLDPSAESQVYFRPVTHILNLITFSLFGHNPFGYHFVNLFLFVAAGFIFYCLIKKVLLNRWAALGAAALLVIHPINSVCVNYKNATGDPFFVLAMGLALWHACADADKNSWNEKILTAIWLALALFCHEIALAFPLYLAALLHTSGRFSWRDIIKFCLPSTVLLAAYFIFRLQFASLGKPVLNQAAAISASFMNFVADIAQIVFWYLAKLVFMKDIVLMWDVPAIEGSQLGWAAALVLFLFAVIRACSYLKTRNPPAALGLMWFVIGFIPVLFACFSRPWFGIIVQPFWLIMSSFGFFLFIISVFQQILAKRPPVVTVLCAFLCFAAIIPTAWRYNDLWGNAARYSEYWMKISPRNFFPRFWLAYSLMDEQNYSRAQSVLKTLVSDGLHYEWTYGNLGIAEYHLKNYKEAEDALKNALLLNPYRGDTHYYLGMVYLAMKDRVRAEKAFRKAVELSPDISDAKERLKELSG